MKTVDKAFRVLGQFSVEKQEIGLSELARMAQLDKAATRRLLVALGEHGFVEQNEDTRKYRLGHGFLRFARIREATVPLQAAAAEVANWLCAEVGETVHVSVPGAEGMTPLAYRLPSRGHVVNMRATEMLYYHATASGMVFLAHATPSTQKRILSNPRGQVTPHTQTDLSAIQKRMAEIRQQGYAATVGTFEEGVSSLAMPFGSGAGDPRGAISIALVSNDFTTSRRVALIPKLKEAVARLERATQGAAP
ncbi:IclR family transcriptional regulator [Sulfitobacter sp. TSTF-M16]|uniref:IclR family transcriptional regulator n=1 Tax=Sulfitobacter aestuariivivens TaxID=2766981 RepID=A0A927DAC7_9RHOB|nr:IclR family transcriptional regulator [Sulfitobacter aestuariivivens]MBD3666102.1 IclR family transcriptional regulator [Sulfitobacter aestuariivivens]